MPKSPSGPARTPASGPAPTPSPIHGPTTTLIIPVHDPSRPLLRALRSVLEQDPGPAPAPQVIVVCHGLPAPKFTQAYGQYGDHPRVRWLEFSDGIASPAGPFNAGFAAVQTDYVAVMGSDDQLDPGAIAALAGHLAADAPDVLIFPLRHDGKPVMPNPLSRKGHRHGLDPVADRLFYRTSPLAWIRASLLTEHGLRFSAGLPAGVDMEFSARLWSLPIRIDFHPTDPAYVIMPDARGRVTTVPRPFDVAVRPLENLFTTDWLAHLPVKVRTALVIKTLRIQFLGGIGARREQQWAQAEITAAHKIAELAQGLAARRQILAGFNRIDGQILSALWARDVPRWQTLIRRRPQAGHLHTLVGYYPWQSLHREADLRRYLRYRTWPN